MIKKKTTVTIPQKLVVMNSDGTATIKLEPRMFTKGYAEELQTCKDMHAIQLCLTQAILQYEFEQTGKNLVTNRRLQLLLVVIQDVMFHRFDKHFSCDLELWQGRVSYPRVYKEYRFYGSNYISPITRNGTLEYLVPDKEELTVFKEALDACRGFSDKILEAFTLQLVEENPDIFPKTV